MKEFFKDIFHYQMAVNQKIAEQLIINEKIINNKSIDLFCHLLNAHQIWNARILKKSPLGVNDNHSLEECVILNKESYDETLSFLSSCDFQKIIFYKNSKGIEFNNTIREILFHIINHGTHHRGQIVMELRRIGLTPVVTDYIFFKR